jgi:hypothetical protein
LQLAIAGFLKAYATSTGEAVYDYMEGRKERLPPKELKDQRDWLVKSHGMRASSAQALSSKALFEQKWTKLECQSHWNNLVQNSGGLSTWQTQRLPDAEMELNLASEDNDLFGNVVRFHHSFVPVSASMKSILGKYGSITLALKQAKPRGFFASRRGFRVSAAPPAPRG